MLVELVQSEVSRSLISGRKDGFGFGGRYIRSTVMEYGGLHLKARHSIDENSGKHIKPCYIWNAWPS